MKISIALSVFCLIFCKTTNAQVYTYNQGYQLGYNVALEDNNYIAINGTGAKTLAQVNTWNTNFANKLATLIANGDTPQYVSGMEAGFEAGSQKTVIYVQAKTPTGSPMTLSYYNFAVYLIYGVNTDGSIAFLVALD